MSTSRKVKGEGRHFFYQIEPNWPLAYITVTVPQLWDRPTCWVTYCSICASTMPRPKTGQGKGSILLWRRFTLPIFLLQYLSMSFTVHLYWNRVTLAPIWTEKISQCEVSLHFLRKWIQDKLKRQKRSKISLQLLYQTLGHNTFYKVHKVYSSLIKQSIFTSQDQQ